MTDPLEKFAELAGRARACTPPPLDVAERVLRDLRHVPQHAAGDGVLWAIGGAALLAACVTLMLGYGAYDSLTDPLAGMLDPLNMVQQ